MNLPKRPPGRRRVPLGKLSPYYHGKKKKRLDYIFTDPQGRFVVEVERNGKKRRRLCKDLTQAKYWAENVHLLFPKPKPKPKNLTVARLIDRYPPLKNFANATRSDRYLKEALGELPLSDLNREVAKRYLYQRIQQNVQYAVTRWQDGKKITVYKDKKPPRKIGPKMANDDIRRLHALLEQALEEDLIPRNPLKKWQPLDEPPPRVRWLHEEEELRFEPACTEEFWRLNVIAFCSGMRQEEQFSCRREQILWEANSIYIPKTKTRKARHIPMSERLRSAVEAQLAIRDADGNPLPWLCPNDSRTNRLSQKTLYAKFHRAIAAAGIEDYVWHDHRHTFCSRLAMAGESLQTIQELAGHERIETTQRYAHLSVDHLQKAVKTQDRHDTRDDT